MTKLSYEELEAKLAKARKQVEPGSKWRHYKGGEYTIKDIVVQEEDNELAVVYQPLAHPNVCFTRPLSVWDEQIEWDGQNVQRFAQFS
jgi:hypothetical protein